MSAEALARVLHSMTDGLDGEGTATWPDPQHREVYALAIEEVAQAILADPAPLLAALAEAGVLSEERRLVCSCGSVRGGAWKPHFEGDDHDLAKEWRYVSAWTEVQP